MDIASVVPFYIELGIAVDSGVPVEAALFNRNPNRNPNPIPSPNPDPIALALALALALAKP